MKLRLLSEFRDVEAVEGSSAVSRHTGRSVREVEVGFHCDDARQEQVTAELNAARDVDSALESDDETRWLVGSFTYSNTNDDAWRFTVGLKEAETVRAERLEFLGLSLVPTHYDERDASSDEVIAIIAEVAPNGEDSETLEQLISQQRLLNEGDATHYFALRRVGVQDEPLQVRFGRCLWQAGDDQVRRHLLVFVAAEGDDAKSRKRFTGFDEPRSSNAARIALQGQEIAEAIIEELRLAAVLTPEALERIKRRGESSWDRRWRDLSETRDLALFR